MITNPANPRPNNPANPQHGKTVSGKKGKAVPVNKYIFDHVSKGPLRYYLRMSDPNYLVPVPNTWELGSVSRLVPAIRVRASVPIVDVPNRLPEIFDFLKYTPVTTHPFQLNYIFINKYLGFKLSDCENLFCLLANIGHTNPKLPSRCTLEAAAVLQLHGVLLKKFADF